MTVLSKEKIQYLARLGLARDMNKLGFYVEAMSNPHRSVQDAFRREFVAEVLNEILDYMATNQQLYDMLRAALERDYRPGTRDAFEAIEAKAEASGIPSEVLLELYDRGMKQTAKPHLTREQNAFNAINSFINKGKAWRDYPDLVEKCLQVSTSDREWGKPSLTNLYKSQTPGQALQTIKKVVKNG